MSRIAILVSLLSAACVNALPVDTVATQADAERVPGFVRTAHDGTEFSLDQALEKGPVVVVFYRGHW